MNEALARERLTDVLALIDRWGDLYERRWGRYGAMALATRSSLASTLKFAQ